MTLVAIADALRALAIAGPATLSPLERRAALSSLSEQPLPPRVKSALDTFVATGAASALLDLVAWVESVVAARAQLASMSAPLAPLAADPSALPPESVADRTHESWLHLIMCGYRDEARAASALLATADPRWLDERLSRLESGSLDDAPWLSSLFAALSPFEPLTARLFAWLERAPRASWAPSLVVALSRSDQVDTDRFERLASAVTTDPGACSLALASLLDRAPERGVRLAFRWLAAGVAIDRASHGRALETALRRYVPEAAGLASARLDAGPFAWEVDKLEQIARRYGL